MKLTMPYKLRGHIVSPRSVKSIRETASRVRTVLGLPDTAVPLDPFLEGLTRYGITVDVLDEEESLQMLPGVEAMCIPETATIVLTAQTYRAARRNDARTRFTIFHELGHFVLNHSKALQRNNFDAKPYLDSEWQADQFSAEITMPLSVIIQNKIFTAEEIAKQFGVSPPAAQTRLNHLLKQREI